MAEARNLYLAADLLQRLIKMQFSTKEEMIESLHKILFTLQVQKYLSIYFTAVTAIHTHDLSA